MIVICVLTLLALTALTIVRLRGLFATAMLTGSDAAMASPMTAFSALACRNTTVDVVGIACCGVSNFIGLPMEVYEMLHRGESPLSGFLIGTDWPMAYDA